MEQAEGHKGRAGEFAARDTVAQRYGDGKRAAGVGDERPQEQLPRKREGGGGVVGSAVGSIRADRDVGLR